MFQGIDLISVPKLRFPRAKVDFERPIFLESADAKDAETDDSAFFINPLHHRIAFRWAHVTVCVREGDFEIIHLGVKPEFQFIAHYSFQLVVLAAARSAAFQINNHDPNRGPVDRDREECRSSLSPD